MSDETPYGLMPGFEDRVIVYRRLRAKYGTTLQCMVAMEELAELSQAISKMVRISKKFEEKLTTDLGEGIVPPAESELLAFSAATSALRGEIADVIIMLEQVMMISQIETDQIEDMIYYKMRKL